MSFEPASSDNFAYEWNGKVLAEYIWLGGSGSDLRSKTKVLEAPPRVLEDLPVISFDGSSCGQANPDSCEAYLKPRAMYKDPLRGGCHILVLCDTFLPPVVSSSVCTFKAFQPHPSNNRLPCDAVLKLAEQSEPAFCFEQEYTLLDPVTSWPLGWPANRLPEPGRPFYGGVGAGVSVGRELSEAHLKCCVHAGLRIGGFCSTAVPGQWSYKIGPCTGVVAADQLWVSRYLLLRLSERFKYVVSFDPNPVPGDWAGAGCFVKFSSSETRNPSTGLHAIQQQIQRLQTSHMQHMMAYGQGNIKRVLSKPQNEGFKFTCGFGSKNTSVMIPPSTLLRRCGHYVDRRPASNMEPYLVCMLITASALGVPLPVAEPKLNLGMCGAVVGFAQGEASISCSNGSENVNTEDVLIDELQKLDRLAPDTPPNNPPTLSIYAESTDECSDGTSPDRRSSLCFGGRDFMHL